MKRQSRKQRERTLRRQRKSLRRQLRARRRRLSERCRYSEGYAVITAPAEFGLLKPGPRSQLHRFLRQLREKAAIEYNHTVIDFTNTNRMFADGALLFFAELHRLIRIVAGRTRIRVRLPTNRRVCQVLAQLGVLRLLKCRRNIRPTREDVVNWKAAQGRGVEGRHYDTILGNYDGLLAPALTQGLYDGLVEAMTNCHHHALHTTPNYHRHIRG